MTSRWSPGPPGTGMPAGRGDRVSEPRGSPRKYQRRISAAFLRPAPHSRRLMRAPLGEQGEGIISEDSPPGINSHEDVNDPSTPWGHKFAKESATDVYGYDRRPRVFHSSCSLARTRS